MSSKKTPDKQIKTEKPENKEIKSEKKIDSSNSKSESSGKFKDDVCIIIEENPSSSQEDEFNDAVFEKELYNIKETGTTKLKWENLQEKFITYYKRVVQEFPIDNEEGQKPENNIDEDIIEYLTSLTKIPFTLQRMAELILEPKLYYKKASKYNSAFKKLVNIDLE